jgi:hypothetical protein
VPVIGDEADTDLPTRHPVQRVDWPGQLDAHMTDGAHLDLHTAVLVDPPELARAGDFAAFAHGRPAISFDPAWVDAPVLDVPLRALGHYSYVFYLRPERRRELFALMERIRPRPAYSTLARELAADLGSFNAAHIRRTDFLGHLAYRAVSSSLIRDNLASVFPAEERLVVCTEADPESDVFVPIRSHFRDVVFLSPHVLGTSPWRERFEALPRHDDAALAVLTQEVAVHAARFVGTFASTFTGIIHRDRHLRDPDEPFLFNADFVGGKTRFEACEYVPVQTGPYSWNRLGYQVGPDAGLAWMREWPEVAGSRP